MDKMMVHLDFLLLFYGCFSHDVYEYTDVSIFLSKLDEMPLYINHLVHKSIFLLESSSFKVIRYSL